MKKLIFAILLLTLISCDKSEFGGVPVLTSQPVSGGSVSFTIGTSSYFWTNAQITPYENYDYTMESQIITASSGGFDSQSINIIINTNQVGTFSQDSVYFDLIFSRELFTAYIYDRDIKGLGYQITVDNSSASLNGTFSGKLFDGISNDTIIITNGVFALDI